MPQLDISFYPSQIFCFVIIFSCILSFATYYISPIFENILSLRDSKINANLIEAEKLRKQAIEIQNKYELANKELALSISNIYLKENNKLEEMLKIENQKFDEKILIIEQASKIEIQEIENKFQSNIDNEVNKLSRLITQKIVSEICENHDVK